MTDAAQHIRRSFTLVEVLIVVMILSIIAAVAIPKAIDAYGDGREAALLDAIRTIRSQIELYRLQHEGNGPYMASSGDRNALLVRRMTERTDPDGTLNPDGSCGPYLSEWPANPYVGESVARKVFSSNQTRPPRSGSTGWYYCRKTCLVSANSVTGGKSMDP